MTKLTSARDATLALLGCSMSTRMRWDGLLSTLPASISQRPSATLASAMKESST
jgi:hypothetical protein